MRSLVIGLMIVLGLTASADAMQWQCFTTYDWYGNAVTNCRWVCDPLIYDATGSCK